MANTYNLEIVSPEKKFFSDDVEELVLNTPGGEIGVLKDHMAMVVAVSIGTIKIKQDGAWKEAVLSEGFMNIGKGKVSILVDTAEWPEEIDINRAKAAEDRARERLQGQLSRIESMQSQAALQRALTRLKVTSVNKY